MSAWAVVLAVAALASAAEAAAPEAATLVVSGVKIAYQDGVDREEAAKVVAALERVARDWPGLVRSPILENMTFLSPAGRYDNVFYCDKALGKDGHCPADHGISVDLKTVGRMAATLGDFYQEGRGIEAILFHELLHGWSYYRPAAHEDYMVNASDGRLTEFQRQLSGVYKKLWPVERLISAAKWRLEIGRMPRDKWIRDHVEKDDEPRFKRVSRRIAARKWRQAHKFKLEDAERAIEKYKAKHDALTARLTAGVVFPRRTAHDTHALDNRGEWIAYGGEIEFYSKCAEELLTEEERAWWKAIEPELKGGAPVNFLARAEAVLSASD